MGKERPGSFRVVGDLNGADRLMNEALFIGTYPGLSPEMIAYELEVIHEFVRRF
jgi:CDP-6-deoxy-D-xylo-4-hexulose-3-dehydrase